MYQPSFGTKNQIRFNSENEYYQLIGFLSKGDGTTILVWEDNDRAGAWAKEGRILFYDEQPEDLRANLLHTAGVGHIISRVNCNEFLQNLRNDHSFAFGETQDIDAVRATVPADFQADFENGLAL